MVFHDFLARSPGDPRGAGESPDAEKMGFVRFGAAQEGFMSNILFYKESLVFFDFNRFLGVPWGARGYPGILGIPGDPWGSLGPIFNRFPKEK